MCAHCDWLNRLVDVTINSLKDALPEQLEVVRRTSPEFYQILLTDGDAMRTFEKGVLRSFAIRFFTEIIPKTGADSEKLVDMAMRLLKESKPVDHTFRTIQAEAVVIQHTTFEGGISDNETKH